MNENWEFLKNTYWYVAEAYLSALRMSALDPEPMRMVDQTVWQITDYSDGYIWGNCAVLIYQEGTEPTANPSDFRFLGSITPDGNVQITFMPINPLGAALGTEGWGRMKLQESDGKCVFAMQMSAGITTLSSHWACMQQTKENEASWNQLPGTNYSVPEFLTAAGF